MLIEKNKILLNMCAVRERLDAARPERDSVISAMLCCWKGGKTRACDKLLLGHMSRSPLSKQWKRRAASRSWTSSLQVLFIHQVLRLSHPTPHWRCRLDSFVFGQAGPSRSVLRRKVPATQLDSSSEYTVRMLNGFNIMKGLLLFAEIKPFVLSPVSRYQSEFSGPRCRTVDVKMTWVAWKHEWHVPIALPKQRRPCFLESCKQLIYTVENLQRVSQTFWVVLAVQFYCLSTFSGLVPNTIRINT